MNANLLLFLEFKHSWTFYTTVDQSDTLPEFDLELFIHCGVATCQFPYSLMKVDTWLQEKGMLYCWGSAKVGDLYIILKINYRSFRWCRSFLHAGVRRVEETRKSRWPRFFTNERFTYLVVLLVSGYIFFTRNKCLWCIYRNYV